MAPEGRLDMHHLAQYTMRSVVIGCRRDANACLHVTLTQVS
jgi:hypothetical protein